MNLAAFQELFDLPYLSHPVDRYINNAYIQDLSNKKRINFKDVFNLGDLRFITAKGNPRTLIGSSAAVQRNNDKTGQLFLASYNTAMDTPSKWFPKKGWRASSGDDKMYKGIYKPKSIFKSPKNIGNENPKINTCIYAGSCKGPCLRNTGNMQLDTSGRSRYLKTWFFYTEPLAFLRKLILEIMSNSSSCHSKRQKYYLRLNGMSDIEWERFIYMDSLVKNTKGLYGFYDYTKYPISQRIGMAHKISGGVPFPQKYKLIYSWDEKKVAPKRAFEWMKWGASISVVYPFSKKEEVRSLLKKNRFLIVGDEDDNRFKDKPNCIVLLKNKGDLKENEKTANMNSQKGLITPMPVLHKLISAVKNIRKSR